VKRHPAPMVSSWISCGRLAALLFLASPTFALAADTQLAWAPTPSSPVPGSLVICGGGRTPSDVRDRFVELAGGSQARIVVIPTASELADGPDADKKLDMWRGHKVADLSLLHTRSRKRADDPSFVKPLLAATGVWFTGGRQWRVTDAYLGTLVEKLVKDLLARGGVVGGTSSGAAIMSGLMIRRGFPEVEVGPGFGFVTGTVIDQHFIARSRQQRLMNVLEQHPGLFGLGIDESTAVVVQGRRLSVLGESQVIACLSPAPDRPAKLQVLKSGDQADLVALSRAAMSRARQPKKIQTPVSEVPRGTLVIVGGGDIPDAATRRFLAAAGGPEVPLVVVSTARGDDPPPESEVFDFLTAAGAKNVRRIHPRNHFEADDPQVLELLRAAGGVWFSGGGQWRLVEAFQDTAAEKLFHDVLTRGGAIGGTSAGAAIQAGMLVRANPLSTSELTMEGYERGFGFLPGTAVDQHFSQRNRFADMAAIKRAHPQLLGLGIDEDTALLVKGSVAEVVGRNQVAFYNRGECGPQDFQVLRPGDRLDLARGVRLAATVSDSETAQAGR
jgi:cyanophycinase